MSSHTEHEQADAQSTDGDPPVTRPSSDQLPDGEPRHPKSPAVIPLPELPSPDIDVNLDIGSILGTSESNADMEKIQKRASNVMKLSQENEKLKMELKAMTDRLEAAERRKEELAQKQQRIMEAPSS